MQVTSPPLARALLLAELAGQADRPLARPELPDVELTAPVLVHSREHLLHLLPAARYTVLLDTTRCLKI